MTSIANWRVDQKVACMAGARKGKGEGKVGRARNPSHAKDAGGKTWWGHPVKRDSLKG